MVRSSIVVVPIVIQIPRETPIREHHCGKCVSSLSYPCSQKLKYHWEQHYYVVKRYQCGAFFPRQAKIIALEVLWAWYLKEVQYSYHKYPIPGR